MLTVNVVTLFPEIFAAPLATSIPGRAAAAGLVRYRVVALRDYIPMPKRVAFTRFNVFLRDRFKCQYCGEPFPSSQLTFEHVPPKGAFNDRPVLLADINRLIGKDIYEELTKARGRQNQR